MVSDDTRVVERLGSFFKTFGRISAKGGKKLATIVQNYPGRALENFRTLPPQLPPENPKAALSSLPEVMSFYHTGKGVYLSNFV